MTNANRKVVSGTTLILSPELAIHVGKSPALVLQQLHYWLSKQDMRYGIIENDVQWIRNSYKQWQKQIPHLSVSTIRRAFYQLEEKGIVQSKTMNAGVRYRGGDQVKYFTINYDALEHFVGTLTDIRIYRPGCIIEKEKRVEDTVQSFKKEQKKICKMSTTSAQNEQDYTTEITSQNNSFSKGAQQNNTAIVTEDNPDQQEKLNLKNFGSEMIVIWNTLIESKENPIELTTQRNCYLNKTLTQFFASDLKNWESFCLKIASSKFLMGEVTPFKAQLDWVLRFNITQKIVDGAYTFGDRGVGQESNTSNRSSNYQSHGTILQPSSPGKLLNVDIDEGMPAEEQELRKKIRLKLGDSLYLSWIQHAKIHMPNTLETEKHAVGQGDFSKTYSFDKKPILAVRDSFTKGRFLSDWRLREIAGLFFEDVVLDNSPLLSTQKAFTLAAADECVIEPVSNKENDTDLSKTLLPEPNETASNGGLFDKIHDEPVTKTIESIMLVPVTHNPLASNAISLDEEGGGYVSSPIGNRRAIKKDMRVMKRWSRAKPNVLDVTKHFICNGLPTKGSTRIVEGIMPKRADLYDLIYKLYSKKKSLFQNSSSHSRLYIPNNQTCNSTIILFKTFHPPNIHQGIQSN